MNKWISVNDKLPQKEGWVTTKCKDGIVKRYFSPILTTWYPMGFSYMLDGVLSCRDDTVTYWQESTE